MGYIKNTLLLLFFSLKDHACSSSQNTKASQSKQTMCCQYYHTAVRCWFKPPLHRTRKNPLLSFGGAIAYKQKSVIHHHNDIKNSTLISKKYTQERSSKGAYGASMNVELMMVSNHQKQQVPKDYPRQYPFAGEKKEG